MKKIFFTLLSFLLLLAFAPAGFVLSYDSASPNFRIEKSSINFSGEDIFSSDNYLAKDTLGEIVSGISSAIGFQASSGYRYMEKDGGVVPPAILGCTDSQATNYNPLATVDNGTCAYGSGGGGGDGSVWGCTDSLALNYNPSADSDNGSCLYSGVPNVSNLRAVYVESSNQIRLTWQNPDYPDLDTIIVRRGLTAFPIGPSQGSSVYNGPSEMTNDPNVSADTLYYYTVFVKSRKGEFSSGAVVSLRFSIDIEDDDKEGDDEKEGDEGDEGEDGAEADEGRGGVGGGDGDGVFNIFPFATTTSTTTWPSRFPDWLFRFIQPVERIKIFDSQMTVKIIGDKDLTIIFNARQAPQSLKTIGVTITDPNDNNKKFSFLLHENEDRSGYQATIGPLFRAGTYPVDIYILNYDDQTMSRYRGYFVVSAGWAPVLSSASAVAVPVATAGLAFSVYAYLYDLLLKFIRVLAYYWGRRRKGEPWGTVYDAITKQPLDPVYIVAEQLLPDGSFKEVSSAISDIDGRFGFFLPAGTYYLKANKTHYFFPSKKLAGQKEDEIYTDLYFGGPIENTGQEVINLNIPMDPTGFDWNEFAKSKSDFFRFYTKKQIWSNRIKNFIFTFGFAFSLFALIVSPSWWNVLMFALYIGLYIFNYFWSRNRKPITVRSGVTGEPLPFAIIKLFVPDINQQIKNVVADKFGKVFILVRPGSYYYTVEEKKLDGSYGKIYQSPVISLPKGILTEDIIVK